MGFGDADKKLAYDNLNAVRSTCSRGLLAYNAHLALGNVSFDINADSRHCAFFSESRKLARA